MIETLTSTLPCPTCGEPLEVNPFGIQSLCPNCTVTGESGGLQALGGNFVSKSNKPIIEADPFNKPQCMAVDCEADELFYGGGAGGGKTWVLLTLAMTKHRRSLILRREGVTTKDIVDKARTVLDEAQVTYSFNQNLGTFRNLPGDRAIEIAGCEKVEDKEKYKGREHDLKCVGRGTPIRMADGTYKPVEGIRVGDMVATLEGACRVSRVFPVKVDRAVRATFRSPAGLTYSQIQGVSHAVLGNSEWVSHDTYCAARSLPSSLATQNRSHRRFFAPCLRPFLSALQGLRRLYRGLLPFLSQWLLLRGHRALQACGAAGGGLTQGSGCVASAYPHEGTLPPLLSCGLPTLRLPFRRLWERGTDSASSSCGDFDAPLPSSPVSYRGDCCGDTHLCDERVLPVADRALSYLLQPDDVALRTPRGFADDGRDKTPKHSHHTHEYFHPYTKDKRQTQLPMLSCEVSYEVLGECELYDFTVESANHYITGAAGVVNRNCFDEVSDFTEEQYTYINQWNRTAIPGQRSRIVATGNPPTTDEGQWVIKRWRCWVDDEYDGSPIKVIRVDENGYGHIENAFGVHAQYGELRYFVKLGGFECECESGKPFLWKLRMWDDSGSEIEKDETIYPTSRTFIPARVADNRFLTKEYIARLQSLDEPLRSMFLYGKWVKFREDDGNKVLPYSWLKAAMDRWESMRPDDEEYEEMDCLGVDPSAGGDDEAGFAPRYGNWFDHVITKPGKKMKDGPAVASVVKELIADKGNPVINIDAISWGQSSYDILKSNEDLVVHGINWARASKYKDKSGLFKMADLRSEMYWRFREALNPESDEQIALPPDPELLNDLAAPTYEVQMGGIKVESKKTLRKRIGRSPNKGDAVLLAYFRKRVRVAGVY